MMVKINWNNVVRPELRWHAFPSRRSQVFGRKGIVATSQPLATEAGLAILRKGGNAADAAVAAAAALSVTETSSCGLGGDAFCLFYQADTKEVKALNGSGRSPQRLNIEIARRSGATGRRIPAHNLNSVTVPGVAAAWVDTMEKFGSGKLTLADALAPAIQFAEEGFPVSELHSYAYKTSEPSLRAAPNGDEMLIRGKAPFPGQIIQYPNLARTLKSVAERGKAGFYSGRVAAAIVEVIRDKGGVMDIEDLEAHESSLVKPISYTYGGDVTVYECPPNGQGKSRLLSLGTRDPISVQGITALLALGILEQIQVQGLGGNPLEMQHNSAEYLHMLIEALRIAFADTQYYVADPDFMRIPLQELLSKGYLSFRARLFNRNKANLKILHGNPIQSSDTVYFSVTDQWGNACSFIQSNSSGFGSCAVPKGCGFTLHSRGSGFILEEGHPNALEGGKRPYHTIIPAIATRGDELFLCYGVMGGFMQPQGHLQVLLNILRGFTTQAALDAPRFCISTGEPEAVILRPEGHITSEVYFEEGIPDEVVAELRKMGHDARQVKGFERQAMGRGQVIQRLVDESGLVVWAAGSDFRADGQASPQV